MKQPPSLRRYMSTCFSCAAIAVLLCVTPKAVYGGPQPGSAHQLHAAFRPGSAAAPFGWATAVADFDADGTPDVAIADRADRPNGSHYRIEVHLAGGTTQSVSFLSADGALNITAIDIDHDDDTDLVVSPVLSREIVGVWLNDGAGRFRRSDASVFPPLAPGLTAVRLIGLPYQLQATLAPERRPIAPGAPSRAAPLLSSFAAASFALVPPTRLSTLSPASPRAPPSHC